MSWIDDPVARLLEDVRLADAIERLSGLHCDACHRPLKKIVDADQLHYGYWQCDHDDCGMGWSHG